MDLVFLGGLPTKPDVPEPGLGPQTNEAKEEGSLNDKIKIRNLKHFPDCAQLILSKKFVGFKLILSWDSQLTE